MKTYIRFKKILYEILIGLGICLLIGLVALMLVPADYRKVLRPALLLWLHGSKGQTLPIHQAAKSGNQAQLASLLATNQSLINTRNSEGETPLHLASQAGHLEIAGFLLTKGAKVSAKNKLGETPLHVAAACDQAEITKLLLAKGAQPDDESDFGSTALNLAAGRNKEIVELLLARGARPDHIDLWGNSPLQVATAKDRENIIRLLFDRGLRINPTEDATLPLLRFTKGKGNVRIANLLLEHGANVNAENKDGLNLLHLAACRGDTNLVQLLLTKGGRADIFVAAGMGLTNRIEELLSTNSWLVHAHDENNWSPLHWAAYSNQKEAVELLLHHEADVNCIMAGNTQFPVKGKKAGDSPLHLATLQNHRELADLLVARGARVNAIGENGETALHLAVRGNQPEMAAWLISQGANLDLTNGYGNSALSEAALNGHQQLVELLLARGADLNVGLPLHRAAAAGHRELVEYLLAKGANIEASDHEGFSPLTTALSQQQLEVAHLLRNRGAKLDFRSTCALGSIDEVRDFLEKQPALAKQKELGRWGPLHYAASAGNKAAAELLINQGAVVDGNKPEHFYFPLETPLQLAIRKGFQDVVELLLSKGADANLWGGKGRSPLMEAVVGKQKQMAEQLLTHGAKVNTVTSSRSFQSVPIMSPRNSHKYQPLDADFLYHDTALQCAVSANDRDMIEWLLARGADANASDYEALLPAIKAGNRDLAEFLIQKGADVNAHRPRSPTLLHFAVRCRQKNMVELLLAHGATANVKRLFGETPLDEAITSDQEDIAVLLRNHVARIPSAPR